MPQPIEEIRKFREKKLKNWQEAGFEPTQKRLKENLKLRKF